MDPIYHITPGQRWERAKRAGEYQGDTLGSEGFIHCSTRAQVLSTADKFYAGRNGLVLLKIDASKVGPEVRYEGASAGDRFPHIYGPLNLDAVVRVYPFEPLPDGRFAFPES